MFETLRRCATDQRCDGSPLIGHQLGEMEELLFLIAAPFSLCVCERCIDNTSSISEIDLKISYNSTIPVRSR